MPSRARHRGLAPLLLLAWNLAGAADAPPPQTPAHPLPSAESVRAAVAALRNDPNLGRRQTIRHLKWVDSKSPPPPAAAPWLIELFGFLGQGLRLLLWVAGAIVLAIAALWGYRLWKSRLPPGPNLRTAPISHVGGLDIRPESLPEDVGAEALALLDAGRAREALSLLYRGALSRAVHRFGVPIAASLTETEALEAIRRSLESVRADYVGELVAQRREAVYAGRDLGVGILADLCRQFTPAFGGRDP